MEKSITLSASRAEKISVQITQRDLGFAIREVAAEMCGNPDDAGCDWTTNNEGRTCIAGNSDWVASTDPNVATLVDAANLLISGRVLKVAGDGYMKVPNL